MARGTQHRKRRPTANARVAQPEVRSKRPKRPGWEDELFFGRLRAHAKWVFLALAVLFAVSFVIFGVGSGSTGISDILQNFFNGTSATGSSLSSLEKQTTLHPKSATAWRNYATKLESDQKNDDAIAALTQYTKLKPKDQDALLELAGLYLRRAEDYDILYQSAQSRAQALAPSSSFQPKSGSKLGEAFAGLPSPISGAVSGATSTEVSDDYGKVTSYLSQRVSVYKKLAVLSPKDATTQFDLAQAAQTSGDTKTAIAAYKKFIVLAPNDPSVAAAKKAIKQLEPAAAAAG